METNSKGMVIKCPTSEYPLDYNFNCIDVIKFICAILVCILHIKIFKVGEFETGDFVNLIIAHAICRIAVPFYFVTAGFLLFRKTDINRIGDYKDRIQGYCFKILRLLGLWTVLLFIGKTAQLWYIGGLVVAVTLLSLLLYFKIPMKCIIAIALVLYLIGMLGDAYSSYGELLREMSFFDYLFNFYDDFFKTTRNGVFMGFIFVLMGALFAHRKIVMNMVVAFIGFAVSMGLVIAEAIRLEYCTEPKDYNMYLSLLPAVFFLFYIATHINLKDGKIYGKLRVAGMLIFYMHYFVKFIVDYVFEHINQSLNIDLTDFTLIFVLTITIITAFLIEWLSNKDKFKWLKWLYS